MTAPRSAREAGFLLAPPAGVGHLFATMKLRVILPALLLAMAAAPVRADEGMWLYYPPPRAQVKAKYGFDLTDAWLEHLMKSSVRFNSGGSASFVSRDGLVITNHHVAAGANGEAMGVLATRHLPRVAR